MDVLIYGSDRFHTIARMCQRAFDRNGHTTRFFARLFPSTHVHRLCQRFTPLDRGIRRIRDYALLQTADEFDPDLVLVVKGYTLSAAVIEAVKDRSGAHVVNWNPDNPFQVRSRETRAHTYLDALDAYDVVYIWGEFLESRLRSDGARRVEILPFAHDPDLHFRSETVPEFACDVTFVGYWSEKRERVLSALTGFNLQIWGPAWERKDLSPDLANCVRGDRLAGETYTRAMSSASIVINVVGDHNLPAHNRRTFEAPASGSLTITTRSVGQQQFFREDEDVVMYDDETELRAKVETYLRDEDDRERIANNGYERVQSHTYDARVEQILQHARETAD